MKTKNRAGFTLIELLVVVLIIGILASVAIPQYFRTVERSRLAAPNSIFGSLASSEESYLARTGEYTINFKELDTIFSDRDGERCPDTGICTIGDGKFEYTIALTGVGTTNPGYTIKAARQAPAPARYGAYTLTYTVPGNITDLTGGTDEALSKTDLLGE